MNRERLAKDITRWEGVRYEKYKCSSNLWTIGVGHMIRDNEQELLNREKPLNNEEVLAIFDKDLSNAIKDTEIFTINHYREIQISSVYCFSELFAFLRVNE